MLSPDAALALTGHAVGGVCPCLFLKMWRYIRISLKRFPTVFPAAGSNSAIELSCGELFTYSHSRGWIDVCKGWQEEQNAPSGV